MVATIKVRRSSSGAIERALRALKGPSRVKVGFPAGKVSGGVLDKAVWNHFGTARGIPPRPFMTKAMNDGKASISALTKREGKAILSGQSGMVSALTKLGILGQGEVQKAIVGLRSPANAAVTIARKGSSNPLIDSGEMNQAVTWKVQK